MFCDDLTFDEGESGYKALKVDARRLDRRRRDNVLIYATSNRRHLLPEYMSENLRRAHVGEEVHPGEVGRGKDLAVRALRPVDLVLSVQAGRLSRRRRRWLAHFGVAKAASAREADERTREALQFALERGSRSGRVAWQFARDWAGGGARLSTARKPSDAAP